jgi:hypothetical protein
MKKNDDNELRRWAEIGMKVCLPGMEYLYERIGKELDEFKTLLNLMQELKGKQAPVKSLRHSVGAKSGWSKMTAEERKIEMRRRMEISRRNKAAKLGPRDKTHPDHAQWAAKISRIRKRAWSKLTPSQKKARLTKMAEGKKKEPEVVAA